MWLQITFLVADVFWPTYFLHRCDSHWHTTFTLGLSQFWIYKNKCVFNKYHKVCSWQWTWTSTPRMRRTLQCPYICIVLESRHVGVPLKGLTPRHGSCWGDQERIVLPQFCPLAKSMIFLQNLPPPLFFIAFAFPGCIAMCLGESCIAPTSRIFIFLLLWQ